MLGKILISSLKNIRHRPKTNKLLLSKLKAVNHIACTAIISPFPKKKVTFASARGEIKLNAPLSEKNSLSVELRIKKYLFQGMNT
mmetsp:Transcript_33406/g.50396  ORF Transcript_33406/g.50396 Transcript_33406/m.50396 type:complete len:85 (-) Transcript_33406:329-583(-)